jgi:hypothetical protein
MGDQLSNEYGYFANSYTFTISGSAINSFTIAFDDKNGGFPTKIVVDDIDYYNDDAFFTVSVAQADTHTVTINNWNKPNEPIIVSGIYIGIDILIDRRNLISVASSIFDRGDYKLPNYGIISNTGELSFNDIDGEIKDYAEQQLLNKDLKVVITLNDTLSGKSETIAIMETQDWDYDNDNMSVSVSLQDDLVEWQDIQVDGINYDPRYPNKALSNGTMEDLYRWLQNEQRTPSKYQMLSFEDLDTLTKGILTNTKVEYPLLKSGNLWEQWTKLCQVCGLYIYKNSEGKTVCSYTYGS